MCSASVAPQVRRDERPQVRRDERPQARRVSGWPIYLDHAATTPVDPAVAACMMDVLSASHRFGNAASRSHAYGREAAALVSTARAQVAALIVAQPQDIIFTSGATESDNLALAGVMRANAWRGRHLVTVRTEHKAIVDTAQHLEKEGFAVSWLEPDNEGIIAPQQLCAALRADTQLVSIMQANNETGVVQDISAFAALCRERDILFHSDAAQSAALLPLDVAHMQIDLLSFTAHKMYGPQGIGALYVAPRARPRLQPVFFGGGHERGLRPGTLATHQIVGFGAAAAIASAQRAADVAQIEPLRDGLQQSLLAIPGVWLNGHRRQRLPNILNVSVEGVAGESLLADIEAVIAVSSGAACDSALGEASYVLRSLGRSSELAQASLRLSLGRSTTAAQVTQAAEIIRRSVARLRAAAP